MLLEDKVVTVSGVGPGLGRALALEAAAEGAHVVCVARTEGRVAEVVSEVEATGRQALAIAGDITKPEDCARVAAATCERFGRLDGLINSAFTAGAIALFEDVDLDDWRQTFEVNVFGTLQMIRAHLPVLRRGSGAIVNVSTMSAYRPMRMQGGYGASKAAMELLTRLLAVELGMTGIRLNTVYCGPMMGPSLDDAFTHWSELSGATVEQIQAAMASHVATGRIPEDEETARAIVMLLSDNAGVVTGATLHATGGIWLEHRI